MTHRALLRLCDMDLCGLGEYPISVVIVQGYGCKIDSVNSFLLSQRLRYIVVGEGYWRC